MLRRIGTIPVEQHLAQVLASCTSLPATRVALSHALGLVLAERVVAPHDLPPFDNAAMDGYAVRAVDTTEDGEPVRLRVVADVPAGASEDPSLGQGEAARVMTGAPMPSDADAVVPLEHVTEGARFPAAGTIEVQRAPTVGAHVRRAGEEIRAGDEVLAPGCLLGPRQLAAAAAAGTGKLVVHPAPRVAVFATGNELVAPGQPLARGQISESNSVLLAGLVRCSGGLVVHSRVVRDEPAALLKELTAVKASVDLIVLAGGVGSGAYDVVRRALADALEFREVAMQPGRPQAFGRLTGGPLVFGLPGNPGAVAVSFEAFVRPTIARLRGLQTERRTFDAVAARGWQSRSDRVQYLPVLVTDGTVTPAGAGRSHFVASLARADAYAVVPLGVAEVRPGDRVTVLRATGVE